jgi:ketosteroid isomerase-like protein
MSEQNLALARRWVELCNDRSDVAAFLSLLAADVEMLTPGGARLRGREQVRAWFEESFDNVRPRIVVERLVGRGDTVVGLGRSELRWSSQTKSLTSPRVRRCSGFATGR